MRGKLSRSKSKFAAGAKKLPVLLCFAKVCNLCPRFLDGNRLIPLPRACTRTHTTGRLCNVAVSCQSLSLKRKWNALCDSVVTNSCGLTVKNTRGIKIRHDVKNRSNDMADSKDLMKRKLCIFLSWFSLVRQRAGAEQRGRFFAVSRKCFAFRSLLHSTDR